MTDAPAPGAPTLEADGSDCCRVVVDCRSIHPGESVGIEGFVYAVVHALARRNLQVILDVCTLDRNHYEAQFTRYRNISIIADPVQGWLYGLVRQRSLLGAVMRRLSAALRRFGIDVTGRRFNWTRNRDAELVYYPYHRDPPQYPGLVSVVTIHAILPEYGAKEINTIATHAKTAAAVTTSWPQSRTDLLRRFPEPADRIFVIPYTAEQNLDVDPTVNLAELGVPARYFFYPASLAPRKNHHNLVLAYSIARRRGIELPPLVCCGGGNSVTRNQLQALAAESGVTDRFVFLGFLEPGVVAALYANCQATVSASFWEAGMAIFQEGWAFAKPAACADIAPARSHMELLGADAVLFDPENPEDISRKLTEVARTAGLADEHLEAARRRIRGFDSSYLGQCYEEVFRFASGRAAQPAWYPFRPPDQG